MIKKVDHIGIVVESLDDCLMKYEKLFHIKPIHVETKLDRQVRIAFLRVGEVMIELLQPLTPRRGVAGEFPVKGGAVEFFEKHGEGLQHIAYRVDDIKSVLAEMKQAGVRIMDEVPRVGAGGSLIAFINPEDTNNVLVELVERKGELY